MSRYIDADALTKEIKMDIEDDGLQEKMILYRINEAPSIDIVRCKECKCFNHFEDKEHGEWNTCERHMIFMNPDDFCSWGERKESE